MEELFITAKKACRSVQKLTDAERNNILIKLSERIISSSEDILEANNIDLQAMDPMNPLYDRLLLTLPRLEAIASDMRHVASLDSPLGRILKDNTLENGLRIRQISVPFGVIGVVYEARPNVTFDVFSLCFKSGNVCILKGGKDAQNTNNCSISIIQSVLQENGVDISAATLLPPTHEATAKMLTAQGFVDLVIPRGGRKLIDFVRENAKVPCIETGAGVVDSYFDLTGDIEIGKKTIFNAKTRRVSVCNALDCLLVHSGRLSDLSQLVAGLSQKNVIIYADERAYEVLEGKYPDGLLQKADSTTFGTEFMDYKMALKVVDSLDEAIEHISVYGSGHSESIITEDRQSAEKFQREVDAACVYVNAPTSFTDGAQFGLGAEIGISTQKLGARGPMALEEITTYKWLIDGNGQTRP